MRPSLGLIVALAASLVLVSCGGSSDSGPVADPSPSPTLAPATTASLAPSSPPPETASPTPAAAADPSDAAQAFAPFEYARVVTRDLRVRSEPEVSDASIRLEPLLDEGVLLLVLDGPVEGSGFEWFLVQPTRSFEADEYPAGWVAAAGKDGEAWLAPASVDCPPVPTDVSELASLNETGELYLGLGCFGGRELAIRARFGTPEATCGVEVAWGTDPEWFDTCRQDGHFLIPTELPWNGITAYPAYVPGLDMGFDAAPGAPPEKWPLVEVTGQFDHEAARTCRARMNYETPDEPEPDARFVILACRAQFVVTSIREIAG